MVSFTPLDRERSRGAATERAHPPITVIGSGRLGGAVARAAADAGIKATVAGRADLDPGSDLGTAAEIALLCVPDSALESACERLCAHVPPIRLVGHTSGATGLEALQSARDAGAETFSLHPLQSVPDAEGTIVGAPAAVAGSCPEALELARGLATDLGMHPFEVPEQARAAYHAAAAIASNFLVTLEQSAVELLAAAGVEDGRELLAPLVLRTAANWSERGEAALTGPIARGDAETVQRHLGALAETAPELIPLYEALAARTRELAAREGSGGAER